MGDLVADHVNALEEPVGTVRGLRGRNAAEGGVGANGEGWAWGARRWQGLVDRWAGQGQAPFRLEQHVRQRCRVVLLLQTLA